MTLSARSFFLNLDSRRATLLFLAALTVGSASLIFNILVPALPIAAVFVYSSILLYASLHYMISHSDMIKNSPYFLAFMLFLISLCTVFAQAERLDEKQILPRLSAALIPTVIGLGCRQFLFAYDASQREQDSFYKSLEEELRSSATEFKRSQQRFVELLQEFIDARVSSFAEEEQAAQRYIDSIKRASSVFDETADTYPKAITKAITQLNQRLTRVLEKLEEFSNNAATLDGTALPRVTDHMAALSTAASDVTSQVKTLSTSIETVLKSVQAFPTNIDETMKEMARNFGVSTKSLSESTNLALDELKGSLARQYSEVQSAIMPIRRDMEAIDQIVTDLVNVLERRIIAMAEKKAV
jgi:hypothetical protein